MGRGWMSGQPGCRPMRIRHYARMRDTGGDTVGQGDFGAVHRCVRADQGHQGGDREVAQAPQADTEG